jgi:hypothetical protein
LVMLQEIFRRGGGNVFVSCVVHVLLKSVFTVYALNLSLSLKISSICLQQKSKQY